MMGSGIGSYFGTLTMLIITVMSIERWLHMSRRSLVTMRRTYIAIAVLLLLPIPFAVCRVLNNPFNIAVNVASSISLIFCLVITPVAYFKVFQIIRAHQQQIHLSELSQNAAQPAMHMAKYKKSVFTILYILAIFLICYLPIAISFGLIPVLNYEKESLPLLNFSFLLVFMSSSLNPALYLWRMKDIRNEPELYDLTGNRKDAINFSLLYLNARSLLKNFVKFTQLLDSSQHEFSAIGISETWLIDINEDYVNIIGYRFISSNRVGRLGGGAGLYLRDTFNFNIMSDLCSSNSALFDSVFVEIENPHGKKLYYRYSLSSSSLLICMNSWNLFSNYLIGTPTNLLLATMAFTDFGTGIITQPLYVVFNFDIEEDDFKLIDMTTWPRMYSILKQMVDGLGNYFVILTVLTITTMSIERWLHISYRSLVTVRRAYIAVGVLLPLPIPLAVCRALTSAFFLLFLSCYNLSGLL
ncbi:unnamed protein product [Porites lobata]|uniref:G-protein coupled receptors family 1 profile domain-containing protein n=1 Tax=Porites lobata TaxID=104759 RepID=A0ABN8QUR3_9CNID|nr:unnamed protein product [Porites lobata]